MDKHFRAGAGSRPGGEDVVHKNNTLAIEAPARAHSKGLANVGDALGTAEMSLGGRRENAAKEAVVERDLCSRAEMPGQSPGLIEFTFAEPGGVKRDGDNAVPFFRAELGFGPANEEAGEEGFEPESAAVFVTANGIEDFVARDYGGS